ncbi:hypothetical protein [Bosea sp. BIWAKO-01]|uniref:hypothetical protein n=1 Tax=Bosea sp. BIWAKO-01 TaxID=506668 RepID=UPI00114C9747|nr:hypothetical protein [Bosea sp. BIWAKO-01]
MRFERRRGGADFALCLGELSRQSRGRGLCPSHFRSQARDVGLRLSKGRARRGERSLRPSECVDRTHLRQRLRDSVNLLRHPLHALGLAKRSSGFVNRLHLASDIAERLTRLVDGLDIGPRLHISHWRD